VIGILFHKFYTNRDLIVPNLGCKHVNKIKPIINGVVNHVLLKVIH